VTLKQNNPNPHVDDRIILIGGAVMAHKCSLTPQFCIEVLYRDRTVNGHLSVICYSFLWSLLPDKFSNNVQLTTGSWYRKLSAVGH